MTTILVTHSTQSEIIANVPCLKVRARKLRAGNKARAKWLPMLCGGLLWLSASAAVPAEGPAKEVPPDGWRLLFDGQSLRGWKTTNFGGEGEVTVEDGHILLDFGSSLTGITYVAELPKTDYELRLEAMRVDGIDFFCGLTFPVQESHCSLIVGGWAGSVVGLSSIDDRDASENETTRYMQFESGRWYAIRIRVTAKRIQGWIDDQLVVDQGIEGRRIGIRNEVELSRPLGIAAWQTRAALRGIRLRKL